MTAGQEHGAHNPREPSHSKVGQREIAENLKQHQLTNSGQVKRNGRLKVALVRKGRRGLAGKEYEGMKRGREECSIPGEWGGVEGVRRVR